MRAPFAKANAYIVLRNDRPIGLSVNDQKERKRTMKKRIVALLLVLVLSMAMMVPVFAAAVEPRACSHNYTPYSYSGMYYKDYGSYHAYGRDVMEICTLCAGTRQYLDRKSVV